MDTGWGGLIMLLAIGVPVALIARFFSRPVDPRGVPRDAYIVAAEGDDPGLATYRLRDADGEDR